MDIMSRREVDDIMDSLKKEQEKTKEDKEKDKKAPEKEKKEK
jgi:hypothetical protein